VYVVGVLSEKRSLRKSGVEDFGVPFHAQYILLEPNTIA
jgi:hypothetical protein